MPEFKARYLIMGIGGIMFLAMAAGGLWTDESGVLEPDGGDEIAVQTIYQDASDQDNYLGYEGDRLIINQDQQVYFREGSAWQTARARYFQEEVTFINVEGMNENTTVWNLSGIPENVTQRLRGGRIYLSEGDVI